ncbi:MAG TPA: sensor histidine kinase, partial [Ktedonobacteraceae bacterium]|nr:sensor histidine kinase [Ktedonobacteraceae bacterium]
IQYYHSGSIHDMLAVLIDRPDYRESSMQNMRLNIEQSNQKFHRTFRIFNLIWVFIGFFSITLSSYGVFTNNPGFIHDWHGAVIILLDALTLSIYCMGVFSRIVFHQQGVWPPSFLRAFPFWASLYLSVTLLALIDNSFSWSFFIVLGLSYALFSSRRLIVMVVLAFIGFCVFQGILTLPFTSGNLAALLGIGLSVFSMTVFSMWMQHIITERFERNQLFEQLAQANAELEEAHRRLEESAAQEQELAVLRERTRLAREMHDTLGHALVLISIKLEAAQRLRERDPERCDRELESTKEIARSTMNDLRASIANLRSPALEREPACRAISRYAREMAARTGLRIEYDLHPDIDELPQEVEETLWKVGQEALTNIEKHAHAQHVLLHISRQDRHVALRITDDGIGLPAHLLEQHTGGDYTCVSPQGHFGLSGMAERVDHAGGHIAIRPGKLGGTSVEVELPLA